jgi:O-antigen/teichoic acid export membrane protein
MGLLAVFFIFDFAINFLSALLRAVKEQAYLLKVTAAVAAGFGLLLIVLPSADGASLMGTFITAQAAWAVLLLTKVVGRWPGMAVKSRPAAQGTLVAESSDARRAIGTRGLIPRLTTAPLVSSFKGTNRDRGATGN